MLNSYRSGGSEIHMLRSSKRTTTLSGKTRPTIAAVIVALAIAALIAGGIAQPAAAGACASDAVDVKFRNELSYPIWLGENGPKRIAPMTNGKIDWEIGSGDSVDLCLPKEGAGGYESSNFWARTECQFDTYYPTKCAGQSDCGKNEDCFGGRCVPDCSQNISDSYCQSQFPGSPTTATCYQSKYCLVEGICATGDCNGQYSCISNGAGVGPSGPTSLFEPTVQSKQSPPGNLTFYNVSLASGYNVPIKVEPSVASSGTCQGSRCNSDLLALCASALQITTAPTATAGPIPCGNGLYCQSGACVNDTCVIGCNDPGDQCTSIDPQCTDPSNDGTLQCCSAIPSGTGWTADNAYYVDMYLAKNYSGAIDSANKNQTMISSNGATPVCWGDSIVHPDKSAKRVWCRDSPPMSESATWLESATKNRSASRADNISVMTEDRPTATRAFTPALRMYRMHASRRLAAGATRTSVSEPSRARTTREKPAC